MRSSKLARSASVVLDMMESAGRPPLEQLTIAEARMSREGMIAMAGQPEPVARVEDRVIPGSGGAPLTVRIYTPEGGSDPKPAFVYFHGGGWVLGDLDTHDNNCRALARRAGAVGIAVDYRLSPEAKFPAAIDDCYAATKWVAANAAKFGVDPNRITVTGDSAGGNMATVVAMKCRDEGGPKLAFQALIYPVTDSKNTNTASRREFADSHFLTAAAMDWFMDKYFSKPEDAAHPHASPLLAENLKGLPPALIITAECDPLRDEGEAYAHRLREAGVPVTYLCYRGMIHAFFSMLGAIPESQQAVDQVAEAIRDARL